MRGLAMRFRGVLRSKILSNSTNGSTTLSDQGFTECNASRVHLSSDIQAVENAVAEPWSNGQTEGQINRLKTLKRAMYGRASAKLFGRVSVPAICVCGARKVRQTHQM